MKRQLYPATRRLLKNLAIVALALAVVVVILGLNLDRILKSKFEDSLAQATGNRATIQRLHLQLWHGALQIQGLTIANSPEFTAPNLIKVGHLQLQMQAHSLLNKTLVAEQLQLDGVELTVEQRQLRNNVINFFEQLEQRQSQSPQNDRRFQIDRAVIKNLTATLNLSILGRRPVQTTIAVPDIALNHLTSSNAGGLVLSELTRYLVDELVKASFQQNQNQLLEKLNR